MPDLCSFKKKKKKQTFYSIENLVRMPGTSGRDRKYKIFCVVLLII